jgi:hypothetical protein
MPTGRESQTSIWLNGLGDGKVRGMKMVWPVASFCLFWTAALRPQSRPNHVHLIAVPETKDGLARAKGRFSALGVFSGC